MTTGEWLRNERLALSKTLRNLSAEVGVSHVFISDIETGKRPIPLGRGPALAAAYGVDWAYLKRRLVADMYARSQARIDAKVKVVL
jgi:transcriptional regulator with XRE-family HTH domain